MRKMITRTNKDMTFAEYVASNVGDKFFTVTFVKANGEERVLTGRLGVTKHTVSGKTKDIHNNYLCVYDVNKKGYRNVNLNTIRKIECGDFKISCPFGYRQMTHEEFSVLSEWLARD
jgi:hypothetical protein